MLLCGSDMSFIDTISIPLSTKIYFPSLLSSPPANVLSSPQWLFSYVPPSPHNWSIALLSFHIVSVLLSRPSRLRISTSPCGKCCPFLRATDMRFQAKRKNDWKYEGVAALYVSYGDLWGVGGGRSRLGLTWLRNNVCLVSNIVECHRGNHNNLEGVRKYAWRIWTHSCHKI